MKVNMVTGKPADGSPVRCLMISEQADEVIDFFASLRANKGVLEETGEKFLNIALFQRPKTTKRSTFHENEVAAAESAAKEKKPATPRTKEPPKSSPSPVGSANTQAADAAGSESEETGI